MSGEPAIGSCPRRRHVIEVVVIGDDHVGLADESVEIRSGNRVVRARTDGEGWTRFEGLDPGTIGFGLFRLDGAAWEVSAAIPLPEDRLSSSLQEPGWMADPGDPPPVVPASTVHAGRGQSVSTIAVANGFTPAQVWSHGSNSSQTPQQELRGEVLARDQMIELPARRRRTESVAVDHRYYVHRIAVPFSVTIRLLDGVGRPRRQLPYLLRISASHGGASRSRHGSTDLDGYLVESITPDATSAELLVGTDERYPLELASLAPAATVDGVQQRLNNLGFWCGEDPPGTLGDATRRAIQAFQRRCDLPDSGEPDEQTRDLLVSIHLS